MVESPSKRATTSGPVHELIATRWSPRAFDPDATVAEEQLRSMLEAARWAPSRGNTQPARYLVGRKGDEVHARIFGTLSGGNKAWAHRASALLLAVALTENAKGTIPHAEYGVGMASQNLVLQATACGLAAHQMAGFDAAAAHTRFNLPDHATPLVAIAVGVRAPADVLDEHSQQQRERAARTRIPLEHLAFTEWGSPAFSSATTPGL